MELSKFNPFVRYIAKRTHKNENINYPEFIYAYDHRLFFVNIGKITFYTDSEKHIVSENEAIIIPPATPYRLKLPDNFEFFIVNFDFVFENETEIPNPPQNKDNFKPEMIFSKETSSLFPVVLRCNSDSNLIFETMLNAYIKKSILYREFISAELKRLIINSMIFTEYDKSPVIIKDILKFLNNNYKKNITLLDIANEFSYHPNYINRIFKKYNGKTVHTYINELKLAEAKQLLRTTNESVSKICELCGFESYSYFIKNFRTKIGMSPLKYRKSNSANI